MTSYYLQHRYQDSKWEKLPDEVYSLCGDAIFRAGELSGGSLYYGMVRVVDDNDRVIIEYCDGEMV